ncbi:MAG TPA: GNAT family N-acetyltransferase [Puia sp.]|nr:GNAT family N-acetyltransferase [Puia sp.]
MSFYIESSHDEEVLEQCARMMSKSQPWITLKRGFNDCIEALHGCDKEVYIIKCDGELLGFSALQMGGVFKGYIQSICIATHVQGKGIGTALLKFCEERIFKVSPNAFICVSSFNVDAARLYYRLGYKKIGELTDFIVRGHDEFLLRKTVGPSSEFISV